MKLDQKALALAGGIFWGVSLFLITLWVFVAGGGDHLVLLKKFYFGYSISLIGAFIGLIWGFIDGAICGYLLGWLYNRFAKA